MLSFFPSQMYEQTWPAARHQLWIITTLSTCRNLLLYFIVYFCRGTEITASLLSNNVISGTTKPFHSLSCRLFASLTRAPGYLDLSTPDGPKQAHKIARIEFPGGVQHGHSQTCIAGATKAHKARWRWSLPQASTHLVELLSRVHVPRWQNKIQMR